MSDDIQPASADEMDEEFAEGWERLTDEPDLRGVEAHRWAANSEWPWSVTVWVAEFLRDDPLEGELRDGVAAALRSVPGVTDVAEEDREVWVVAGQPSGRDLVASTAAVVDALAERARPEVEGE